jgi:type I restriction enzyme S subunit
LHNKSLVEGPGIIVGRKGSVGEVAFSDGPFWPIDTTYYVANRGGNNWRFLYFLLQHLQLTGLNSHSTVPGLNRESVYSIEWAFPPKSEQEKIAAVLWKIQTAVAIEGAIVRNARDLEKSLLRRLFTHGLRGEPLKETEIGKVPKNWTETTLGEVCTDNDGRIQTGPFGSQLHASDYRRDGLPVVNPTHLSDNKINHADIPRISREKTAKLGRHVLQEGDILFGRRGEIGRHGLVGPDESGWLCGTGCFLVRVKSTSVCNQFLSFWFSTEPIVQWLNAHAAGAIMPNLNNIVLGRIPLVLPDIDEQREIADILQTVDLKIEIHESKKRSLEDLFKTTLHKLMTVQIRVNDLDVDTSEVSG